jgi:hypothetical protein
VSQQTLDVATGTIETQSPSRHGPVDDDPPHLDIATALSQMTFRERVSAYEHGIYTHRELCAAAAREPERMPILNGEFEWIAVFSADLD